MIKKEARYPIEGKFERFDCLSSGICPDCGKRSEVVSRQGTPRFLSDYHHDVEIRRVWTLNIAKGYYGVDSLGSAGELDWECFNDHKFTQAYGKAGWDDHLGG